MEKVESLLLGFLFLKGGPVKKSSLFSLLDVDENAFSHLLLSLKKHLETLPFAIIESDTDIELTLNKELTELFDPYIKRERESDLTPSTLETLSAIAYSKKPTKFLVSYIRGVSATQSISSLIAKDLIEEDKEGVYHLTTKALSHLGVTRKEELPSYSELSLELEEKIASYEEK